MFLGSSFSTNRMRLVSALRVGLVVALLLALYPSRLQAQVACGGTVTGAVTLSTDLACVGNGLTVGADVTTIHLNGHTISCADGGYLGSCQGLGFVGIDTNTHNDVLIEGPGTITGFQVGVKVNSGSNINVRNLTVTGPASPGAGSNPRPDAEGILVEFTVCPNPRSTIVNIHGNNVSNQREGIMLENANCVNVGFNSVHDDNSDPVECHGILANGSGSNNFNNNTVTRNGENLATDGGLTLEGPGSANNTITHNNVSGNCGDGISARFGATNNNTTNNLAEDNSTSSLSGRCFDPVPGFFADLAARSDGSGNVWNKNNECETQLGNIPAGVCRPSQ